MRGPRQWRIAALAWTAVVLVSGVLPLQDAVHGHHRGV